jgi:hypothetical protein
VRGTRIFSEVHIQHTALNFAMSPRIAFRGHRTQKHLTTMSSGGE